MRGAFQSIFSSDTLRSVVVSALTAGATQSINLDTFGLEDLGTNSEFVTTLLERSLDGVIRSGISSTIGGTDFSDAVFANLRFAATDTLLAATQTVIGDLTDGVGANDLPVMNMLLHAVAGGIASEALGNDFTAGVVAALASSATASSGLFEGLEPNQISAISQLIGGVAALIAGGDGNEVGLGAHVAQSAAINNYLTHANLNDMMSELRNCQASEGGCSEEEERLIAYKWQNVAVANDKALVAICADTACVEEMLSPRVEFHDDIATELRNLSPTVFNILHAT